MSGATYYGEIIARRADIGWRVEGMPGYDLLIIRVEHDTVERCQQAHVYAGDVIYCARDPYLVGVGALLPITNDEATREHAGPEPGCVLAHLEAQAAIAAEFNRRATCPCNRGRRWRRPDIEQDHVAAVAEIAADADDVLAEFKLALAQ